MDRLEKKKELHSIVEQALENDNPMLVIAEGDERSVNFVQGNMIGIVRILFSAMKRDERFEALFRTAVDFKDKRDTEKSEKLEKPDCDNCEAKEDCPIKDIFELLNFDDDLLKDIHSQELNKLLKSMKIKKCSDNG